MPTETFSGTGNESLLSTGMYDFDKKLRTVSHLALDLASALGMMAGVAASTAATTELLVPRSMPTTFRTEHGTCLNQMKHSRSSAFSPS